MKTTNLLKTLVASAVLCSIPLHAATLKVANTPNNGGLTGGEFEVTINPNTPDAFSFYSFCLERGIPIYPGNTIYDFTIDETVLLQTNPARGGNVDGVTGDRLSKGTVYLYEQFLNNSLFEYLDDRYTNAGLLQVAFWVLEDEYDNINQYNTIPGYNKYIDYVTGVFGGSLLAAKEDADLTTTNVRALNIWQYNDTTGSYDRQSMLIRVPDTASTLGLLGLAFIGLSMFRRRS